MILDLIRINQWYKNFIIFIAVVFSLNLFSTGKLFTITAAFFSLSLLSSANYIINDFVDRKRDMMHPVKKNRPVASGKISSSKAIFTAVLLVLGGLKIAFSINPGYFFLSLVFVFIGLAYTVFLKNIFLADAITISINFILRAVLGAVAIGVSFSSWLIVCTFLMALTLVFGKRRIEIMRAGKSHRHVLKHYNIKLLDSLSILSVTSLLISYAIYTVNHSIYMPLTLPLAAFLLFRYMSFLYSGSHIIENPENLLKDRQIFAGSVFWAALVLIILYVL